jgi:pimeloyl-ACP methyl ester carboxylesterase
MATAAVEGKIVTTADGAEFLLRRLGNPHGSRLVLSHGNGFAIDAYEPFWSLLAADFELVLYDQRNHGRNPPSDTANHDLPNFVEDMETIFHGIQTRFGLKPSVGVFHSISAVTSIWHGLTYGRRWDALVLFDPPLIPPPGHRAHEVARRFELMLVDWAKQRRNVFDDPAEQAEAFARSSSLRRWVPGAYELMARSILRRDPADGKWHLRCPREAESQVYKTNSETHISDRFPELPMPVKTICADPDQPDALAPAKVWQALHEDYDHEYDAIADTSHLLMIERPEACARSLRAFLDKIAFA